MMRYFVFHRTYLGFKQYNQESISQAIFFTNVCRYEISSNYEDLEDLALYTKLLELDEVFLKTLDKVELNIVKKLRINESVQDSESGIYEDGFKTAYEKWVKFYSEKKDFVFSSFSARALGKVMEAIRKSNDFKKTELADLLNVDRKTIYLIESGDRFPSLEYIYKFAKTFKCSIDELLKLSIR